MGRAAARRGVHAASAHHFFFRAMLSSDQNHIGITGDDAGFISVRKNGCMALDSAMKIGLVLRPKEAVFRFQTFRPPDGAGTNSTWVLRMMLQQNGGCPWLFWIKVAKRRGASAFDSEFYAAPSRHHHHRHCCPAELDAGQASFPMPSWPEVVSR